MSNLKIAIVEDSLRLTGVVFIIISAILFGYGTYLMENNGTQIIIFFLCYSITTVYTITILFNVFSTHGWRISRGNIKHTSMMLILWLISAFALNLEMAIFASSTIWLSIYLCISATAIIALTFHEHLSTNLKHVLSFSLGAALLLFVYFAIYLVPMYAVGALAAIFLGLSAHVYSPLFLAIIIVIYFIRLNRETPVLTYSFIAGIALPLLTCVCFLFQWHSTYKLVNDSQHQNTSGGSKLPVWVDVASHLPQTALTERFLKADLIYTTPSTANSWFWGDFGRNVLGETKKHDPLIMISALLIGKSNLEEEDKIHILKSVFDSRHLAQDRLWSGDDLLTTSIFSNIKIYPEYRMAYTEKTINIKNTDARQWNRDQEAIYTFYLPEGAVVSSLSLWINGVEEHARLSTKSKTDSAYKTIVGVERRDPSVVHWQEGNEVTVRIFPCNNKEERKFKIGITSPLLINEKRLVYKNTSFEGPSPKKAKENIQVSFSTVPMDVETDLNKEGNKYQAGRNYQDSWEISLKTTALAKESFSFAGSGYRLKEATSVTTHFKPEFIYLDINSSWTKKELDAIWANVKSKKVYVFDQQLIQLNNNNVSETYERMSKLSFSLFPFYEITDLEKSLVISKSNNNAPNLSDLNQSDFQSRTSAFLAQTPAVYLYHIGILESPYLQTLKQFNSLRYSNGDVTQLITQLQKNQFKETEQSENLVNITASNVAIQKTTDTTTTKAPDHLLRLFAYNDILRRIGPTYFRKDYVQEDLLVQADQAFIVTPVSSLIVLETKKDYDRFDIEESKNSLQNASLQSSGAAPEPHEWMLIILSAAVIIYFTRQSPFFSKLKLKW